MAQDRGSSSLKYALKALFLFHVHVGVRVAIRSFTLFFAFDIASLE